MATYTVSAGHRAVGPWNLTASQVDTVTFTDDVTKAQIVNEASNSAEVYVTTDGSTPAVPAAGASSAAYRVPVGTMLQVNLSGTLGKADSLKVISSGTPRISVQLLA